MSNTCRSSGKLSSSGIVSQDKTLLSGVQVISDGTNAATVTLHDNDSAASGDILFEGRVSAGQSDHMFEMPHKVQCRDGIYATIAGTGAGCIVYHG